MDKENGMLIAIGTRAHFMESLARIEPAEREALKRLALDGGLAGPIKVSCSAFGDQLGTSTQTASRRLQALDDAGFVEREFVSDGQLVDLTDAGRELLRSEYEVYRQLFEENGGLRLRGAVTAGMGEGRHYIMLDGYHRQFVNRLGYEPFPGTLNLTLDQASIRRRSRLSAHDSIPIDGWEDDERTYGPAACYPASVETPAGEQYDRTHVIVPERTHHDEDHLEVIAPDKLRTELHLEDDDLLDVVIGGGDHS